ncbi:MAG: NapC/NirT family cytochrome c [Candidatus Omnitrophica bacterium]|nr:NapC/NirT family cytochrome c [Candidatus Omnitrophota bacterium]MBI3020937.1 NapC/NirT family cytochrome c [Candidatus Omnitrophota bacterium]MBI3083819.1 NapC/NirT family cytochrome c [Candidatus Omnitrophota bacterium]
MSGDRASKPSSLLRNPVSLLGIAVAGVSTAFGLPMMFLDMFSRRTHPYLGVLVYLVLPFVASGGVMLIVLGVIGERRRRRRQPGLLVPPLPSIDLNRPAHQVATVSALTGLMVLVVLLSVTGYRAYHFTESVSFCGLVCHQVMKPEYTAYQHSPHARVACTQCHVGPGASWFVRSKITGAYQVYAVALNKYPRPIQTPIKNLRPAQETCEQCHWPAKFFGAQQKTFNHYLADEANSPWQIQMLIKVGGGDPKVGAATGIHWHMNIKNEISYVASDERREVIPWVRVVDPEGHVTEYMSTEQPLTPEQVAKAEVRRMDCVDCHNRPSHIYRPPDRAVEEAFDAGRMDRSLPYLKREAVRLLAEPYATEAQAKQAILKRLAAFYQAEYPALSREKAVAIHQATEALQQLFAANLFPEMQVSWRAYPNHVGHLNAEGCFRCHDGLHTSREGKVITKDCNACHTILAQGPPEEVAGAKLQEQPFRHPVDVGMDVTEFKCSQCHTGTSGL